MTLTVEHLNALMLMIEFHTESFTDDESMNELNELVGTDVDELYNILGEMRDDA